MSNTISNSIINPIGKVGFTSTPKNMESFQKYLSQFNGSEAVVAQTCAWMAWNLASKIVDEAIAQEKVYAVSQLPPKPPSASI